MDEWDTPRPTLRLPRATPPARVNGYQSGRGCHAPGLSAGTTRHGTALTEATSAGGERVWLRPAGADDLTAALALHGRCSAGTLARRYPGGAGEADDYLRHLLGGRHGCSVAAELASGELVGLGHVLWDGDESEVALLVADAWQRRGIGGALLRSLLALATARRCASVYAVTEASNAAMLETMRSTGLPLEHRADAGVLVVSARLADAVGP
ncbi:GNAT family N-acetyltransferase [Streptomyces sp. NBRC 109706]|uniref:GNAT family N-acetyltransferase n=1 Tax=Streptomyces sp. NBRC 109706 TaxID=1550035 RepID=UPI00099C9A04|nr:GNAT family N-acetyltransferase [Streptomyces sp. NBRC 109706]